MNYIFNLVLSSLFVLNVSAGELWEGHSPSRAHINEQNASATGSPRHRDSRKDLHEDFASSQLLVVTTKGWDTIQGQLSVYEWKNKKWEPVYERVPVVVGKKGLAWGKGLMDSTLLGSNRKREGDGRSPAGIFPLNSLFGYSDMKLKMRYVKVDTNTFCVDDTASAYYNQIVHGDTVSKDWNSAETMRLKNDGYKYGIVVGYNTGQVKPGDGSCIFIHLWNNINSGTAGCTAMQENDMINIIKLLDKKKNPLLVQMPESDYKKIQTDYKLP